MPKKVVEIEPPVVRKRRTKAAKKKSETVAKTAARKQQEQQELDSVAEMFPEAVITPQQPITYTGAEVEAEAGVKTTTAARKVPHPKKMKKQKDPTRKEAKHIKQTKWSRDLQGKRIEAMERFGMLVEGTLLYHAGGFMHFEDAILNERNYEIEMDWYKVDANSCVMFHPVDQSEEAQAEDIARMATKLTHGKKTAALRAAKGKHPEWYDFDIGKHVSLFCRNNVVVSGTFVEQEMGFLLLAEATIHLRIMDVEVVWLAVNRGHAEAVHPVLSEETAAPRRGPRRHKDKLMRLPDEGSRVILRRK